MLGFLIEFEVVFVAKVDFCIVIVADVYICVLYPN